MLENACLWNFNALDSYHGDQSSQGQNHYLTLENVHDDAPVTVESNQSENYNWNSCRFAGSNFPRYFITNHIYISAKF